MSISMRVEMVMIELNRDQEVKSCHDDHEVWLMAVKKDLRRQKTRWTITSHSGEYPNQSEKGRTSDSRVELSSPAK